MEQYSRGVTLVDVHTGTLILVCVFAISLLSSSNSSALAVDPILDTVLSVTKMEKTENSENKTNNGNGNKSQNGTVGQSTPSRALSPIPSSVPVESDVPVVAEPLAELPTIDVSDMQRQSMRVPTQNNLAVVTSEVLGVKASSPAAPLQASDEGWKFFGVVWYWWILGGGVVYYVTRQLINLQRRRAVMQSSMVS